MITWILKTSKSLVVRQHIHILRDEIINENWWLKPPIIFWISDHKIDGFVRHSVPCETLTFIDFVVSKANGF